MQETKAITNMEFSTAPIDRETALAYANQFISTSGYEEPESVSDWAEHDTQVAVGLGALSDCPPLSRGDHILAMRRRSPNGRLSKLEMGRFAKMYKMSASRLYSNATTAENFDQTRRPLSEIVGYSHLEVLNGLPQPVQDELLIKAEKDALTVEDLTALAEAHKLPKETDDVPEQFTGAIDQSIPEQDPDFQSENSLSGLGSQSSANDEGKQRPDNEYEQMADELEGDESAYSWTEHEVQDDRRGLAMLANDPIAAADQMVALIKSGAINEGWVATFIAALTQKLAV